MSLSRTQYLARFDAPAREIFDARDVEVAAQRYGDSARKVMASITDPTHFEMVRHGFIGQVRAVRDERLASDVQCAWCDERMVSTEDLPKVCSQICLDGLYSGSVAA